jgi:uncharacterized membrane protein (UPF0127 family)
MNRASRLTNETTGADIAEDVAKANTLWQRLSGLLPYKTILPSQGLWFDRCSAVHTIGMRATIDIIFLDEQRRVVRFERGVKPNRLRVGDRRANSLIELGSGLSGRDINIGDTLTLQDNTL